MNAVAMLVLLSKWLHKSSNLKQAITETFNQTLLNLKNLFKTWNSNLSLYSNKSQVLISLIQEKNHLDKSKILMMKISLHKNHSCHWLMILTLATLAIIFNNKSRKLLLLLLKLPKEVSKELRELYQTQQNCKSRIYKKLQGKKINSFPFNNKTLKILFNSKLTRQLLLLR